MCSEWRKLVYEIDSLFCLLADGLELRDKRASRNAGQVARHQGVELRDHFFIEQCWCVATQTIYECMRQLQAVHDGLHNGGFTSRRRTINEDSWHSVPSLLSKGIHIQNTIDWGGGIKSGKEILCQSSAKAAVSDAVCLETTH